MARYPRFRGEWGRAEMAQTILAYLRDQPDAADTLTGIVQFWVLRQAAREAVPLVQEALRELAKAGVLEVVPNLTGDDLYRLKMQ